jgi:hypothetical protein
LNIWWVCWEDPNSVVARVLGGAVELVVGYIVIVVVFILNVILSFLIYSNRIPSSAPSSSSNLTSYRRQSQNKRLTRTLLVVAVVFLVCETPRLMMSLIVKFIQRTPIRRIILNASFALSGINHAANFFIYIVLSPRFRQLLVESLKPSFDMLTRCLRKCHNSSTSSMSSSSSSSFSSWKWRRIHHVGRNASDAADSKEKFCCCSQHHTADSEMHEVTVQFNLDVFVGPAD